MLEKLTAQQRLILASIISVIFFVIYEFTFAPKAPPIKNGDNVAKTTAQPTAAQPLPAQQGAMPSVAVAQVSQDQTIAIVKGAKFDIAIDRYGRFSQVWLEETKFRDKDGAKQKLLGVNGAKPLELRFVDPRISEEASKVPYESNVKELLLSSGQRELVLTQKLTDVTVTKRLVFAENGSYTLDVTLSKDLQYYITPGIRPDVLADAFTFKGTLLTLAEGKVKTVEDGDAKSDEQVAGTNVAATVDRYYTTMLYSFAQPLSVVVSADMQKNPTPFIVGKQQLKLNGYIGPKYVETLTAIDARLADVVEYGFFTFIAKPMFDALAYIEKSVGNWGWAIVILTIAIRIVLFPLTFKGMVSMSKLKDLAPKLTELREKYKGDPQKLNIHMMDLYKKHGANPMGGCLPLLLQIPVFFAIYRVLLNAIELKGAEWIFWINDLSLMDPYYVLPILMGATMYLQQRITPSNFTDPIQEKIFRYLPIVFTFFFVAFPAGLTLYWFVNNVLSIIQQMVVNKMLEVQKEKARHHDGAH